jgi:hypothetical protein
VSVRQHAQLFKVLDTSLDVAIKKGLLYSKLIKIHVEL